jgi:hypothetical protein
MEIIKKSIILESAKLKGEIRTIVRDIIDIFKKENEGEFYLPSDLRTNEEEYSFPKFNLQVELIIQESNDVDDFLVNAELYREEGVIAVIIVYNPENKNKVIYNLIGELNEIIAHELRHIYQQTFGTHNLDIEEPEDPFEYYTQPHELDAQVAGFKRMSQITKRPFEEVVRNWFKTHKSFHYLNDDQVEKVIKMILDHKN